MTFLPNFPLDFVMTGVVMADSNALLHALCIVNVSLKTLLKYQVMLSRKKNTDCSFYMHNPHTPKKTELNPMPCKYLPPHIVKFVGFGKQNSCNPL